MQDAAFHILHPACQPCCYISKALRPQDAILGGTTLKWHYFKAASKNYPYKNKTNKKTTLISGGLMSNPGDRSQKPSFS